MCAYVRVVDHRGPWGVHRAADQKIPETISRYSALSSFQIPILVVS